MATTTNVIISEDWVEIVDDETADFFLSLPVTSGLKVEILTWGTTGDSANIDTQYGHVLTGKEQESISRAVIGNGFVYARCRDGALNIVLSK